MLPFKTEAPLKRNLTMQCGINSWPSAPEALYEGGEVGQSLAAPRLIRHHAVLAGQDRRVGDSLVLSQQERPR